MALLYHNCINLCCLSGLGQDNGIVCAAVHATLLHLAEADWGHTSRIWVSAVSLRVVVRHFICETATLTRLFPEINCCLVSNLEHLLMFGF